MRDAGAPLALVAATAALIVIAGCGNQSGPGGAAPPAGTPAAAPPPRAVEAPATPAPDAPAVPTTPASAPEAAAATAMKAAVARVGSAEAAQLYAVNCTTCHGPAGRGDGALVAGLPVKPRSFGADEWRFVDFADGPDAVHAAIEKVLREGIRDAMMPGYTTMLTDAQINGLIDHVLELRRRSRDG